MGMGVSGLAVTALVFAPGLALSSALNTFASRLPERRRSLSLRSTCSRCGSVAGLLESIALISYLSRRGRCTRCGATRSLRYPFLEVLTGFLCVASFTHFGFTARAFVGALFCALLVVIAAIDFEHRLIPNAIVVPGAAIVLVGDIVAVPGHSIEWISAAAAAGFGLLVLALVYRGALGMGDVKLAFLLGAGLGKATLVAFLVGLTATFFFAVMLVATRGIAARKETIPLAPFLALGGVVALLVSAH